MPPCAQCAGMIIQAGIIRVVTKKPTDGQTVRWIDSFRQTVVMFDEADVVMEYDN